MPEQMFHQDDEIWVSTSEGAELTGYSQVYLMRLAQKNLLLPEVEQVIRVRKRKRGYDIWLPDLMHYRDNIGNGASRWKANPPIT